MNEDLDATVAAARRALSSNPPPVLYHCTSGRGLIGSLKSQRVWAGHADHTNDSLEVVYAQDVARRIVSKLTPKTDSGRVFLEEIANQHEPFRMFSEFHFSSFTEQADQLSQWRAYANDGLGFAVGLRSAANFGVPPIWFAELQRVVTTRRNRRRCLLLPASGHFETSMRVHGQRTLRPSCAQLLSFFCA